MAASVQDNETRDASAEVDDQAEHAPHQPVERRLVTIEHPCIVKNLNNGLRSLGGEPQLRDILEHKVGGSQAKDAGKSGAFVEPMVGVSLRPNDVFAKRIPSVGVQTRNVLIKVTLPKCVGRKRKRDSNEAHVNSNVPVRTSEGVASPDLIRRLRDNQNSYHVRAIGVVRDTHRFRNLPDVQLGVGDLPIMRELKEHIIGCRYDSLKNLHIDMTPGATPVAEYPGPPSFLGIEQPYPYGYQQASGVVYKLDEKGQMVSENKTAAPKRGVEAVACDIATVPSSAPPDLVMRDRAKPSIPEAIQAVNKLLDQRPLVSKRVMVASLPQYSDSFIKEATQWTGYSFKSGPFRDLHIKYGVDPRSDPRYRIYQALTFHRDPDDPIPATVMNSTTDSSADSYIFDGKRLSLKGKTWQVCDVTDPVLRELLETAEPRSECDVHQWGWYSSGTITRARVIMRDKISRICSGDILPDSVYQPLLLMPVESEDLSGFYLDETKHHKTVVQLAAKMRQLMRANLALRRQNDLSMEPGSAYDDRPVASAAGSPDAEEGAAADDDDNDAGDFDEEVADEADEADDTDDASSV